LRTNVPETPPCPPTARQSGGIDWTRWAVCRQWAESRPPRHGLDTTSTASSQFGNSSAGGPPSGKSCSCSVWSPTTPDAVPPANQSVEVGNGDARKLRGLTGPVIVDFRSFLSGVRPWLASVRPASSTARSRVFSGRRWAARGLRAGGQPRDVEVQPAAQVQGSLIQGQAGRGRPQVQSVAVGAAAKTVPAVAFQVGGEGTTAGRA
jgi:hypothetical protein